MGDALSLAIGALAEDARYLSDLRRRVAAILESRQDVDDVIQDTWVQALEAEPAESRLRAWCTAKALELASQALDRTKHDAEAAGAYVQLHDDEDHRVPEDIQHSRLAQALARLTPGDRALIRRRYWREQSWRKIARDLGGDMASVQRRHRRILRDLKLSMTQPSERQTEASAR